MQAFEMHELIARSEETHQRYLEFLRVPELSAGVYRLAAGGDDPQQPHSEDEVYYVVSGRGRIRVGDQDRAVMGGSLVYVAKNMEHRFHSIEEDLTVLAFFAPAENSPAGSKEGNRA